MTENHTPLIAAIKAPRTGGLGVSSAAVLAQSPMRVARLLPRPAAAAGRRPTRLLPPFTRAGDAGERAEAFIRHLHKFFAVPIQPPPVAASDRRRAADPRRFRAPTRSRRSWPRTSSRGRPARVRHGARPGRRRGDGGQTCSPATRTRRRGWRRRSPAIDALFELTDIGQAELQFSLIEALYARGFTSARRRAGAVAGRLPARADRHRRLPVRRGDPRAGRRRRPAPAAADRAVHARQPGRLAHQLRPAARTSRRSGRSSTCTSCSRSRPPRPATSRCSRPIATGSGSCSPGGAARSVTCTRRRRTSRRRCR